MEHDLVIEASPLFFIKSRGEEKQSLNNEKTQNSAEAEGSRSPDVLDNSVFPQDFFPNETNFPTTGSNDEEGVSSQTLNTDRNNNTRQESTRILDIIKHSPKFLRKKYTKQSCKNVTVSPVEDDKDFLQDFNSRVNLENAGIVSPKTGIRKKIQQLSGSSKDTATEASKTLARSAPVKCKSPTYDQESSESGTSKGRMNWRKVKAALKRVNDSGEELRPVLPGNEENGQGVPKIRIKIPSESSIHGHDENEDDIYKRLKSFLTSSDRKCKTPRSPRLQLRSKFSFWPKGLEGGVPCVSGPKEGSHDLSSSMGNPFPVLKTRMYPLGIRRSSAPETVLRREAEAFSLVKKAKELRQSSQNKSLKQLKTNPNIPKLSDPRDHEIKQKMQFTMKENLQSLLEYCPVVCSQLGSTISEQITKYLHSTETVIEDGQKKFACLVYIGAVKDCGIYAAVRSMWSPGEDRLIVSDYQNKSLYAIAIVFVASC